VLASNRHTQPRGLGAVRELRETILGLLEERGHTLCAECVATALGHSAGSVMMSILGLGGRVASFQGVCSACHRRARVIKRVAAGESATL
jgi:hypothetical protein